jgi:hypothetical protein
VADGELVERAEDGERPLAHPVTASVLWCGAITAVSLPLAVRRYITR